MKVAQCYKDASNVGISTSSLTGGNTILDLHKSGSGCKYCTDQLSFERGHNCTMQKTPVFWHRTQWGKCGNIGLDTMMVRL